MGILINTQLQYNPNVCTVYVYSVKPWIASITLPRTKVLVWSVTLWKHAIIWQGTAANFTACSELCTVLLLVLSVTFSFIHLQRNAMLALQALY